PVNGLLHLRAAFDGGDPIAHAAQVVLQQLANVGVVVDNEYVVHLPVLLCGSHATRNGIFTLALAPTHSITKQRCFNTLPLRSAAKVEPHKWQSFSFTHYTMSIFRFQSFAPPPGPPTRALPACAVLGFATFGAGVAAHATPPPPAAAPA